MNQATSKPVGKKLNLGMEKKEIVLKKGYNQKNKMAEKL